MNIGLCGVSTIDEGKAHSYLYINTKNKEVHRINIEDIYVCRVQHSSILNHYCTCIVKQSTNNAQKLILQSHQLKNAQILGANPVSVEIIGLLKLQVEAADVYLIPLSKTDWNIVSTQAIIIEDIFLRQYALVYEKQILRINLSSSLHVEFTVSQITSSAATITSSLYSKVNQSTKLVISPIATEDPNQARAAKYWSDVRNNILTLRVLPQRFRRLDSSFGSNRHLNESPVIDDTDELFQLVDEMMAMSHRSLLSTSNASNIEPQPSSLIMVDEITTYINPADYHKLQQSIGSTTKDLLALVSLAGDPAGTIQPIASQIITRVVESSSIRCSHISLDDNSRFLLGIVDYVRIQLRFIDPSKLPMRMPISIIFHPILYNTSSGSSSSQHADTSGSRIESEDVFLELFTRYRDQHCHGHPLPLCDQSIISIDNHPQQASSVPRQDYLVKLHYHKQMTSSESSSGGDVAVIPNLIMLENDEIFAACLDNHLFHLSASSSSSASSISLTVDPICLQQLSNYQHRGLLVNHIVNQEAHSPHQLHNADLLHIYHPLIHDIMTDLYASLHPEIVNRRLGHNIYPSLGCSLTGSIGCGKSMILSAIASSIASNAKLIVHIEQVSCKQLRGQATAKIIAELSHHFTTAVARAPSLILMDDLDLLLPAYDVDSESEVYSSAHDAISLISLHLERWFDHLEAINHQVHRLAYQLYLTSSSQRSSHSVSRSSSEQEVVSDVLSSGANSQRQEEERIIDQALQSTVFVIASMQSASSLFSRLRSYLIHEHRISSRLRSSQRTEILEALLRYHDIGISHLLVIIDPLSSSSNQRQQALLDEYSRLTEGFSLYDYQILTKQIANDYILHRYPDHLLAWSDIFRAIHNYKPPPQVKSSSLDWENIGGVNQAKQRIKELLLYPSLFPKLYANSPIKLPRGILLYGPSGVGKTILAEATAIECGLNLIAVKGPELLNKYIGASEKAVREIFERARESGRSTLIFFDEFEALASKRGKDSTGVTDRVVNQLLTFLDGVEDSMTAASSTAMAGDDEDVVAVAKTYVIAATSRPDLIDVALLRPGRIECHVYLGIAKSTDDRRELLASILRHQQGVSEALSEEILAAVEDIIRSPTVEDFSGADYKAFVSSAYLRAVHDAINARSMDASLKLLPKHLHEALQETKPSISSADKRFYSSIYQRFQREYVSESQSFSIDLPVVNETIKTSNGHQAKKPIDNSYVGQHVTLK
jgi:SpoVK/Ycf46/Vps4 family AAA+-type ATPase